MYDNITSVIIKELYPVVAKALEKNDSKFRNNISKYFNDRHELMFAIAPYDRIYFNQNDIDDLYKSLGLSEKEIKNIIANCFFYDIPYNPQCVKEPYVMTLLMAVRYYLKTNKSKNAELTLIYLAFTGKFYSSIHGLAFPTAPPSKHKEVMDYVINNMLTDKFDLKKEGTVFGAIKSLCITWISTYGKELVNNSTDDEKFCKEIQQLRDRERAFMMNIAKLYYKAIEEQLYLNYETDSVDPDEFRITDTDATKAARLTEVVVNYMMSNKVSLKVCNQCKDQNVSSTEICNIIEAILGDNSNIPEIKRAINIIICDFMRNYPGTSVKSVEFVSYTIKAKPNTHDKYILELKNIITSWLDENSPNYRRRKSRKATAISYYRSILMYFALTINSLA